MTLGIIGAMDVEVETLKQNMTNLKICKKAGMEFWTGTLHDCPVTVVRCGIGKVNAALCVQLLADCFGVTHIINTGVAGSLDAALDIGDIVISKDAMYHDVDCHDLDYAIGQVPDLDVLSFPADAHLVSLAEAACAALDLRCKTGRIASGDQFVCQKEIKNKIIANTGALCTEMEGAAIAHAAYLNDIPCVILRAISDKADESAELDYPTFEQQAAHHCASLVLYMTAQM